MTKCVINYCLITVYNSFTAAVRMSFWCETDKHLLQMSEVVEDSYVYHALGDMLYHIEHEGQQPEFWFWSRLCIVTGMAAQQAY